MEAVLSRTSGGRSSTPGVCERRPSDCRHRRRNGDFQPGLLLSRGATVYAVEPNFDMRETAKRELHGFVQFHAVAGSAEHTGLRDQSVDGVSVAQAFHWFDPMQFRTSAGGF